MHKLNFKIELKGSYCLSFPSIIVGLNQDCLYEGTLLETLTITNKTLLKNDTHNLWIIFKNKTNNNSTNTADQAVIIEKIEFEGIFLPRFLWASTYTPQYPEPYATEQRNLGKNLPENIEGTNYLGFNGKWNLQFTTPIFTWIHKLENLGWIYD